jgi:hypothetical protein
MNIRYIFTDAARHHTRGSNAVTEVITARTIVVRRRLVGSSWTMQGWRPTHRYQFHHAWLYQSWNPPRKGVYPLLVWHGSNKWKVSFGYSGNFAAPEMLKFIRYEHLYTLKQPQHTRTIYLNMSRDDWNIGRGTMTSFDEVLPKFGVWFWSGNTVFGCVRTPEHALSRLKRRARHNDSVWRSSAGIHHFSGQDLEFGDAKGHVPHPIFEHLRMRLKVRLWVNWTRRIHFWGSWAPETKAPVYTGVATWRGTNLRTPMNEAESTSIGKLDP